MIHSTNYELIMKQIIPIKLVNEGILLPYVIVDDTKNWLKISIDEFEKYVALFDSLKVENWWEIHSYQFDWNLCVIIEKEPKGSDIWSPRSWLSIPMEIVFWITLHEIKYDEDSKHHSGWKRNYESYIDTGLNIDNLLRITNLLSKIPNEPSKLNDFNKSIRYILLWIARKWDIVFDVRFAQYVAIIESFLIKTNEQHITKKIGKRLSFMLWIDPRQDSTFAKKFSDYHYDKRCRIMHCDHVIDANKLTQDAISEVNIHPRRGWL